MISRAVAYIISDGQSFVLESPGFKAIGQGKLFGMVPYGVIIFLVVTAIAYVLLARTKFGRYVYATGGNIRAAIASGVNVFAVKVAVYSMMGVCAAIAGIILSSRVNAGAALHRRGLRAGRHCRLRHRGHQPERRGGHHLWDIYRLSS